MAQNIQLKNRVRYFPTKTKADILPRLGCNFVGTVIFNCQLQTDEEVQIPANFLDWQTNNYLNYAQIVGVRDGGGTGTGLISNIDVNIFNYGLTNTPLNVMNTSYPVYYGTYTNPNTGLHSGFMFYDVYNVIPNQLTTTGASDKVTAFVSVDIYESTEFINDATQYTDINS
jgi:hypothetical protein